MPLPPRHRRPPHREALRAAWTDEHQQARTARRNNDPQREWEHLERAHILSQPFAGCHVRTHLSMAAYAMRHRDVHELGGQLTRLLVAGPGSLTRRYPLGNTGGADVNATRPMPVPPDLEVLLGISSQPKTLPDTASRSAGDD